MLVDAPGGPTETRMPVARLQVGTVSSCARVEYHRWHRRPRHLGGGRLDAHRESVPVEVGPDDVVEGATVNVGGRLVVEATRVGADTSARADGAPRRGGTERQG